MKDQGRFKVYRQNIITPEDDSYDELEEDESYIDMIRYDEHLKVVQHLSTIIEKRKKITQVTDYDILTPQTKEGKINGNTERQS